MTLRVPHPLRTIALLALVVALAAIVAAILGPTHGALGGGGMLALGTVIYRPSEADTAHWGGHNRMIESWWAALLAEAEKSPKMVEAQRLIEAETKMDFATWLYGYVATAFFGAYEKVESQWRLWAGVRELRDFNELRIKAKNRLVGFGYVGDHAHRPGMRRSYRPDASIFIDTYGAMHEVTRQAIINQDTDQVMKDDPEDMGTAAAEYLIRALVALVTSNPTAPDGQPFYAAGGTRNNLVTVEVSAASLMAAWTAFQTRVDVTNQPIRINPRRLVVQNRTIASIAWREINSQQAVGIINDPANSAFPRGDRNPVAALPWPSDFVVEEPYLPDFNDAYMFADPERFPAFIVGFLRGQNQQPSLWQNAPERRPITAGGATDPYQLRISKITYEVDWDLGLSAVNPDVIYAWRPA